MNIVVSFVSAEVAWADWGCGVVGVGAGIVVRIVAGVAVGVGP